MGIDDDVRKRGLEEKGLQTLTEGRKRRNRGPLSGRLFQMVCPATGKAWPPMVDSFTDGTSRRTVRAERRQRRLGRSAGSQT